MCLHSDRGHVREPEVRFDEVGETFMVSFDPDDGEAGVEETAKYAIEA